MEVGGFNAHGDLVTSPIEDSIELLLRTEAALYQLLYGRPDEAASLVLEGFDTVKAVKKLQAAAKTLAAAAGKAAVGAKKAATLPVVGVGLAAIAAAAAAEEAAEGVAYIGKATIALDHTSRLRSQVRAYLSWRGWFFQPGGWGDPGTWTFYPNLAHGCGVAAAEDREVWVRYWGGLRGYGYEAAWGGFNERGPDHFRYYQPRPNELGVPARCGMGSLRREAIYFGQLFYPDGGAGHRHIFSRLEEQIRSIGAFSAAALEMFRTNELSETETWLQNAVREWNDRPVARAGEDRTVTVGTQVTLHGSAGDPDTCQTRLTVRWSQVSGPQRVIAVGGYAGGWPFTFTPDRPGKYVFRFDVLDGLLRAPGAWASDTVTITVQTPLAAPVITSPGTATGPGPVIDSLRPTLRWSPLDASVTDYGIVITRYPYRPWEVVYTTGLRSGRPTSYTVTQDLAPGGRYHWQMMVRNAAGQSVFSNILYFQTRAMPTPAFDFAISADPSSRTVTQGGSTTTTVRAWRTAGPATIVNFTGTGLPTGVTASPSSWSWELGDQSHPVTFFVGANAPVGTHTITIQGTGGGVTRTATFTLTVTAPAAAFDFSISADPSSRTVTQGGSTTTTVRAWQTAGPTASVSFGIVGLPTGVTASPSSWSWELGDRSHAVTISVGTNAPVGTHTITIQGTGGGVTRTATFTLTIEAPAPAFDFAVSADPSSRTVTQGGSTTTTVRAWRTAGPATSVSFTVIGLPTGVTASPSSWSGELGNGSRTVTFSVGTTAPVGIHTITIQGAGGGVTRTATFTLTIEPPVKPAFDFAVSVDPLSGTAAPGGSVATTVRAWQTAGPATIVNFTGTGLPTGVTASPSSWSWELGDRSHAVTFSVGTTAPVGTHTITIQGTGGGVTRTATFTLTIEPPGIPARGQIAFTSWRGGNRDIYVMNADGTNKRRLTTDRAWDWFPAWSPDGRQIAFTSSRDENAEIYVMNADGTNQLRLTNRRTPDFLPTWSPCGRQIAFTSGYDHNSEIYVMNADGTNLRRLTNHPAYDGHPAWSPCGRWIAFSSSRDGNPEIYVMNADGTNQRGVTNRLGWDGDPAWSPCGRWIAFSSARRDLLGFMWIYVMNTDGTNRRKLSSRGSDRHPTWSPCGRWIAFTSLGGGNLQIYVMDADGSNLRRLTHDPASDEHPAWSPVAP